MLNQNPAYVRFGEYRAGKACNEHNILDSYIIALRLKFGDGIRYSHPRCQAITKRNETDRDTEAKNVYTGYKAAKIDAT
jgi:hypothetical protein